MTGYTLNYIGSQGTYTVNKFQEKNQTGVIKKMKEYTSIIFYFYMYLNNLYTMIRTRNCMNSGKETRGPKWSVITHTRYVTKVEVISGILW
jgi:hypothetical protein